MSFPEPQPSIASSISLLRSASGVCLGREVSGTRSSSGQSRSPGMWICIRTPSAALSFTVGSLRGWFGEVVGYYSRSVLLLAQLRLFFDSLLTRSDGSESYWHPREDLCYLGSDGRQPRLLPSKQRALHSLHEDQTHPSLRIRRHGVICHRGWHPLHEDEHR